MPKRSKSEAARARHEAELAATDAPEGELASVKGVDLARDEYKDDPKGASKRIAELEAALAEKTTKLSEVEKQALQLAESQGLLMQQSIVEVPTGSYKLVPEFIGYKITAYKEDGRPIRKPRYRMQKCPLCKGKGCEDCDQKGEVLKLKKEPTYYYKIDLPPIGGLGLVTNGENFEHGSVRKYTMDELRSVKERVWRCWDHDRNVHGSDENSWRKDQGWQHRANMARRAHG